MATCAQLVSEQEVQALSIDAATSNVEVHYAYICDAFGAFMQRYRAEHASHAGGCCTSCVYGDRVMGGWLVWWVLWWLFWWVLCVSCVAADCAVCNGAG